MDYDVIVVGAGPAGATAAKYAAENGLRTLLLDKDTFPREKPCAGGLCYHITQFSYLKKYLTKESELVQSICQGSITYVPKDQCAYSYHAEDALFYTVYRKDFDMLLVKLAKQAGAVFISGAHVTNVQHYPTYVEIRLSDGACYTGTYCIVADGPMGKAGTYVRNCLGVEKQWKQQMSLSLVEELPVSSTFIAQTYGSDTQAVVYFKYDGLSGYAWVFPKKDSINIGYAGSIKEMKQYDVRKGFQQYVQFLKTRQFLPKESRSRHMRGGLIPWKGPLKRTWYQRMVLVGDAAGFVSPLSGEGIFYAMDSGRIAATTIMYGINRSKNPKNIFRSYHKTCMESWGRSLLLLRYFRNILLSHPSLFLKTAHNNLTMQKIYGDIFNGSTNPLKESILLPWLLVKEFFFLSLR